MGIIGVVAALTLPNLNSSTGDKEKVTKVKKIYSNFEDALGRAQAVYGPISEWFQNDNNGSAVTKRFAERMIEFMKVSKDCGFNSGCFTSGKYSFLPYTGMSSAGMDINAANNYYKVILSDGTSMAFSRPGHVDNAISDFDIAFDIDGPNRGSYIMGKDVFIMCIDVINNSIELDDLFITECPDTGLWCFYWVIKNDNMDYTKIDSNGKCKNNSSIVLDGVSNITCK